MQLTLLLFCFIIFGVGITFSTLGYLYGGTQRDIDDPDLDIPTDDLTLAVGGALMLFSGVGMAGAITEKKPVLISFSISMIFAHVCQQVQAVMAFIDVMRSENYVRSGLPERFSHYNTSETEATEVDTIQQKWKCCGIKGPQYWTDLPKSCCAHSPDGETCPWQQAYRTGCAAAARSRLTEDMRAIGSLAVISGALEIVLAAYSWYLAIRLAHLKALREEQERHHNPRGVAYHGHQEFSAQTSPTTSFTVRNPNVRISR